MTYCVGIKVNAGLVFASDSRTNAGVYQVSIVAPANPGKTKTNPLVAELTALFPLYARDTKAGLTVVTMSPVDPGPGMSDPPTYTVPVSFEYRADTA